MAAGWNSAWQLAWCCWMVEPVHACSREIGTAAGGRVTTIEGLGSAERRPHPLQQAFLDEQAGQCGYWSVRHHHECESAAGSQSVAEHAARSCERWTRTSVAAWRAPADPACGREGCGHAAGKDRPHERHSAAVDSGITDGWRSEIRFQPDRTVRLAVGKASELGQGECPPRWHRSRRDELDVNLDRISVLSGDTQDAPDEGQTTSSQSIEVSGRSVRLVSAELRARVLDRLAQRLNCSPTELSVEDGIFRRGDAPTGHDYWSFAAAEDFARDIDGSATPKPHTAYRYVGKATPRRDLPAKVAGAAFIHGMKRPGHAPCAHPAAAVSRRSAGVAG